MVVVVVTQTLQIPVTTIHRPAIQEVLPVTELITMLVLLVIWLVAMAWKGEFFITLAKQYYIRKIESWDTSGEPHDIIVAELEALRAHAQANRWLRQVS